MRFASALALSALLAGPALAQPGAADGAYRQAIDKMNASTGAAALGGDPDQDFIAVMIPAHQGAIDLARAYLAHGHDPELTRLAKSIVANQSREIEQMKGWPARRGD